MTALIERFNRMLATLAGEPDLHHVHRVDLQGLLSNELSGNAYRADWANELHPKEAGFEKVADRFQQVLAGLP